MCIVLIQPSHWHRVIFLYQKLDENILLKNQKCIFVAYRIKLEITGWILYPYYSPHNVLFSNTASLYVISSDSNAIVQLSKPNAYWRILNDNTSKKTFLIKIKLPQLKSTPLHSHLPPIKVVISFCISGLVADMLLLVISFTILEFKSAHLSVYITQSSHVSPAHKSWRSYANCYISTMLRGGRN